VIPDRLKQRARARTRLGRARGRSRNPGRSTQPETTPDQPAQLGQGTPPTPYLTTRLSRSPGHSARPDPVADQPAAPADPDHLPRPNPTERPGQRVSRGTRPTPTGHHLAHPSAHPDNSARPDPTADQPATPADPDHLPPPNPTADRRAQRDRQCARPTPAGASDRDGARPHLSADPPERGASPGRLRQRVKRHGWPAVVGLVLGLLALGPALGRGFVLTYDMVFVPDPPISLADLGATGSVARAVPSDLIVALASRGIPAQIFQKIILISIFVLACAGACALAERLPMAARLVAGVCFTWNPFVAERLIMGQWAALLGYAALPWVMRELTGRAGLDGRDRRDGRGGRDEKPRLGRLALTLVPAAVGGFAAMSITAVAALPVAWFGAGAQAGRAGRARRTGVVLAALAVASLPWVIPSLIVPVHADPAGAAVFAARADTPFGALGSLLMLGGVWNAQAVPSGYGGAASVCWLIVVLAALVGYLLVARPRRIAAGLGVAAMLGYCVAAIGTWSVSLDLLKDAISFWPGFALLRDGQQFIAPLVLATSIGLAAGVAAVIGAAQERTGTRRKPAGPTRPSGPSGPGVVLAAVALLAPVLLLPGLAWGAVGRLRAVEYPADWVAASKLLDGSRAPGSVLLLPWAQYRQYPWNHGEPVFDPWPRMLTRPMIWNDALRVGTTTVAPESESARQLGPAVTAPGPMTFRLVAAGVRYVIVDAGPLLGKPQSRLATLARLPGAQVMLASPDLIIFRLPAYPPT
jgi:hypothetical protein